MTLKTALTTGLLVFVFVSLVAAIADVSGLRSSSPSDNATPAGEAKGEQWIVYYFHSSTRCPTCRGIEANARAAVAEEVKSGVVEFRVLNYEEPAHRHFAVDFDLAFPSVILALEKNGSTLRWSNLDRVWELCEDRPAFVKYVQAELARFKEVRP